MKTNAKRVTKKHFIVYAMSFGGLNGANRKQILRYVHTWLCFGGSNGEFKPGSNTSYFLDGTRGNGHEVSLINQGLIKREKPGVFVLTDKGRELADQLTTSPVECATWNKLVWKV